MVEVGRGLVPAADTATPLCQSVCSAWLLVREIYSGKFVRRGKSWKRAAEWRDHTVGLMFWLRRKKLVGSYLFLRATSRS